MPWFFFFFLVVLFFNYLSERAHNQGGGQGGRERERVSPADFLLSAEPDLGLNLNALRVGHLTNQTIQVP